MKKIVSPILIAVLAMSLMVGAIAEEHEPVTLKFSMTATTEEHHGTCCYGGSCQDVFGKST